MFIPLRNNGLLYALDGTNAYGEKVYCETPQSFGWAFVYDRLNANKSAVRADSSASKSRAEQEADDVRLIVSKSVTPKNDDKIIINGNRELRIIRVQERMDIVGRLHHWEISCVTL